MRAPPPPPIILTAVSAFQRRASAQFLRRPRTGKIATSVITRVYAEKAAQGLSGHLISALVGPAYRPAVGADRLPLRAEIQPNVTPFTFASSQRAYAFRRLQTRGS
jgi:hypothetical protein